jgi:hypothetical protein
MNVQLKSQGVDVMDTFGYTDQEGADVPAKSMEPACK